MKILKMRLENFQGVKELEIDPQGESSAIYGDNGTGKSTVYNAFTWLMYGKPSTTEKNYTPKTTGSHNLHHSVEMTVELADGSEMVLKKDYHEVYKTIKGNPQPVLSGHTTDYSMDGVPVSETQFKKNLLEIYHDEELAKMKELLQYVADSFPEITSLLYVINNKCNDTIGDLDVEVFSGKDHIFEEMEGLRFKVGPKSFYQTNSEQAYNLYKVAREFAGLEGDELVYDLYTGTGTIANFVSRRARKVIGIEYVPEAIEDAKVNSQINGITNTLFYAGDMKDILTEDFIREHGRPDVIITDPPRAGMHNDVINVILAAEPKRIVYVSCNPATQARDLQLLDGKYKVTAVQPVDMFPHTHHVENVVLLEKREEPKH